MTFKVNGGLGYPVYTRTGNVDREWHLAEISLGKEYTGGTFQVRTNIKYGRVNLVSWILIRTRIYIQLKRNRIKDQDVIHAIVYWYSVYITFRLYLKLCNTFLHLHSGLHEIIFEAVKNIKLLGRWRAICKMDNLRLYKITHVIMHLHRGLS